MIKYLLLLFCIIFFQSCFDIVEQVFLQNNGSGNFQLMINMSKSKTKIDAIAKMKMVDGHDVPSKEEIEQKVAEIEKTLSKTAGIRNVKTNIDFENYITTLSCDFNKVINLNTALKNISDKEKSKTENIEKTYVYDVGANTFTRLNNFSLKEDYTKMSSTEKEILAAANYISIYKFESSIVGVSNKEAKISPSKKGVMLKQKILDLITNKQLIENKINLIK